MKQWLYTFRKQIILSSVICLIPILAGLFLWDRLPDAVPIHWNAVGEVDGYAGRGAAVFGMPVFFLVIHAFCILATLADGRNKTQSPRALAMIFWIMPTVSMAVSGLIYTTALGYPVSGAALCPVILGVMSLFFGNYFPKIRRNSTLGIRIPWALYSEENWNHTHRLAGKLWFGGGMTLLLCACLPIKYMIAATASVLLVLTVVPFLCSYLFYRKEVRAGICPPMRNAETSVERIAHILSFALTVILTAMLLVTLVLTLCSGNF